MKQQSPVSKLANVLQRVDFGMGSGGLPPRVTQVLDEAARVMQEHRRLRLDIQGHLRKGDEEGIDHRRAQRIADYLIDEGNVDPRRLETFGGRDEVPELDYDDSVWSVSRRVKFNITG